MTVVLALERLKQKDHRFKTKLGYKVTPCLKKKNVFLKKLKNNELCDGNCLNYSAAYNDHI